MSGDSIKGDKKVPLVTTIPESQLDFLEQHFKSKKYENRSVAVREAIALLQSPDALKNELKTTFGQVKAIYPANGHDYSDILDQAESITLVFNDMRRWLDNHRHREVLRGRLIEGRHTRILLLHPRSNLMNFVAKISNKLETVGGKNRQVRDVERAVRRLCTGLWQKVSERQHNELPPFRIIGHRYFNTYTLVMTESQCWVVWYPIFKRYNEGVIFVFEKTEAAEGLYTQFKADIDELERVSVDNHHDSDLIKLLGPPGKRASKKKSPSRVKKRRHL
jgi:Arc/MetJ-type ribon-helix-helix transcriptional regulator